MVATSSFKLTALFNYVDSSNIRGQLMRTKIILKFGNIVGGDREERCSFCRNRTRLPVLLPQNPCTIHVYTQSCFIYFIYYENLQK